MCCLKKCFSISLFYLLSGMFFYAAVKIKSFLFVLITEIIRVNVVVPLKTFVMEKKT